MSRDAITRLLVGVFLVLSIGAVIWFETISSVAANGSTELWGWALLGAIAAVSLGLVGSGYDAILRTKAYFQASLAQVQWWTKTESGGTA